MIVGRLVAGWRRGKLRMEWKIRREPMLASCLRVGPRVCQRELRWEVEVRGYTRREWLAWPFFLSSASAACWGAKLALVRLFAD
jgi:hypothetical protein